MKVLKIFKKPVFLITLVVLAAILSVSMIAVGAENAELGGSVSKYQVGMQGSVMFKLTLTDAGAGMEDTGYYRATVGDRNCGTYPVSQVKTDGYIVVRLYPTEMSKTVTVTAVKGNEECEIWSGSVKNYANTILNSENYAASHNVMRAMLNWGAKTETNFIKDSVSTTADDIFARNSDPMNAVTADTINADTHTSIFVGSTFVKDGSTTEIILGEGNVSLRFKIKANENLGPLPATVSRDGWTESKTTTATYDSTEACYIVNIDSISTLLFDKVYTVSISNGTDSVTAYASVLENLDKIIEGKGSDTSEGVKNVAKTLYQFYLLSADKTDSECQHNVSGYWIPNSVTGKDRYMCSACFEQLMNENVELYMSPYDLNNNAKFDRGSADSAIMNDGAFPYIRYSNPKPNENDQIQYSIIPANNEAVTGRYLVMKYRYQKETASSFLTMYACTKGNEKLWSTGNIRHHLVNNKSANYDGKWNVLVVDLALYKGTTSNSVYVPNESGEYIAGAVYLRLFGNDFDNPWNGECKNPTETDFIDFAYIAMVDELADLKEFVSEPTYHFGYNNNWFHTHYTFSNMCYGAYDRWGNNKGDTGDKNDTVHQRWTITETNHSATGCVNCGIDAIPEEPHTYGNVGGVRKCTVCGYVNTEFFLSAEDFNSKLANANKTDFTQKYVADQGKFPYFHVERTAVTTGNRYGINIVNLFPDGKAVKGKYLIIKYRSENGVTSTQTNAMAIYGNTAEASEDGNKKQNYKVIDSGEGAGKWYVMVCDLSTMKNEDLANNPAKLINIRLFGKDWSGSGMTNAAVGDYFDIAYMAIVDDLEEVKNIVCDTTYYVTQSGSSYTEYSTGN